MARKVKCRICGKTLEQTDAYLHIRVSEKTKKEKREYYCSQLEYEIEEEKKQELNKLKSDCFTYIHDTVLQLEEGQLIPLSMTKRIGELSNYYPYQVIRGSFVLKLNDIQYALSTKEFKSDHVKGKYVMAIIENVINDVNGMWKRKQQNENKQNSIKKIVEVEIYDESNRSSKRNRKNGISEFLEDGECDW